MYASVARVILLFAVFLSLWQNWIKILIFKERYGYFCIISRFFRFIFFNTDGKTITEHVR